MSFELKKFPDADALARAAANDWLNLLGQSSGPHLAAFSGGRIAKNLFNAVASQASGSPALLQRVDFFWADERCVPPDDPESNFFLAKENLFDRVKIPEEKIHRLKGELPPAAAVEEANATIQRIAPKNSAGVPILDLIFLGLGEDGHIASLMPNASASTINSQAPFLHVNNSPKPPPNRISLSYAAIAAAKNVWMLASGKGKEEALRNSLLPKPTTPFGRLLQLRSQTVIYTDIAF